MAFSRAKTYNQIWHEVRVRFENPVLLPRAPPWSRIQCYQPQSQCHQPQVIQQAAGRSAWVVTVWARPPTST